MITSAFNYLDTFKLACVSTIELSYIVKNIQDLAASQIYRIHVKKAQSQWH